MKKILLPTEFSAHAGQVFLYALDLAKRYKASVCILHAYHTPINPKKSMEEISNETMMLLQDFVEQHRTKEYKSVEVQCIAEMGFAADAILQIAQEENIDLIVMGMKGKTNAIEAYFGSVSLDVVSRTDVPVFLVPSTNRFKALKNVAFALDLKMSDLIVIESIQQLIGKVKANITCVHIEEKEEDWWKVEKTISFLKDLFRHHPTYKAFSFFSKPGIFEEEIQNFVVENDIDLLITQSRKRNWKFRFMEPSSSNKIARKITIPMLILKEETKDIVLEKDS